MAIRSWAVAALTIPVAVWGLANLLLTLTFGHPTEETVEAPLLEVGVFFILGASVFAALVRARDTAFISLLVLALYCILIGLANGASIVITGFTLGLLVLPIAALLVATVPQGHGRRLLEGTFWGIAALQLVLLPLNYSGRLSDANVALVDRFTGSLLGRGGYLSSYLLIAAAGYLVLRARSWFPRITVSLICLSYCWLAEVKFGFVTFAAILAVAQFLRPGAKKNLGPFLKALGITILSVIATAYVPPAWTLNHPDIPTFTSPGIGVENLLVPEVAPDEDRPFTQVNSINSPTTKC